MAEQEYLAQMSAKIVQSLQMGQPQNAEKMCRTVMTEEPSNPLFNRLLAHALLKQNKIVEAEKHLKFFLKMHNDYPQHHEDLGSILALQGKYEEALEHLEKSVRLDPTNAEAHKKLGQVLANLGRGEDADEAFEQFFQRDPDKQAVAIGMEHLRAGRMEEAEDALKKALRKTPDSVDALRMLAVCYMQQEKNRSDAEALLRRAVDIAPDYTHAWMALGSLMQKQLKGEEAVKCFQAILRHDPDNVDALSGLGASYALANNPVKALEVYEKVIEKRPEMAGLQMGYGHVLKTTGDQEKALEAYRKAVELQPDNGEVYWSMANLKIFKFEDSEIAAMEYQISNNPDLSNVSTVNIRFALGKAYEDVRDYDKAWENYEAGNEKQREMVEFDPVQMEAMHDAFIETFDEEFIENHQNVGCEDAAPIFIVGLPRSGSTLIEQILASHSQVEGTAELSDLGRIASSIGKFRVDRIHYPRAVRDLRDMDFKAYGEEYLEAASAYRLTDKPFFTDKLPNNFAHIGLISLILPNAKIIDTRRHPLDSCLGAYKQLFAAGQNFTYDYLEIAEYYQQYDRLMQHWHKVLPGKVYVANYEDTVLDLETQVRGVLDHCELDFEENCINFHETKRAVQTASSEQVRQPIYTGALGKWRKYEDHLDGWKDQLEDILEKLPDHIANAGNA